MSRNGVASGPVEDNLGGGSTPGDRGITEEEEALSELIQVEGTRGPGTRDELFHRFYGGLSVTVRFWVMR